MSTLVTTNLRHGGAASPNIVLNSDGTFNIGSAKVETPAGSAPIYACRAWVNFNGTGTVAIRASGNVSSITDNGVGNYTVNFTTAMPDINYSVAATSNNTDSSGLFNTTLVVNQAAAPTTTAVRVQTGAPTNSSSYDCAFICVSIFR